MARHIVHVILGILSLAAILYVATRIAARTSITRRKLQAEAIINASPSRVWRVLTDFNSYPEWNPFLRQIRGAAQPGARLVIQMRSGDHLVTMRPTVLAVQPEKELRWLGRLLIPGLFDGEHSFVLEPLGRKYVRLIQSETFNGLLVPFSGKILKETERSFIEMNAALKEKAE